MFNFLWRLHDLDINAIAQRSAELVSRYSGDLDMTLTDECLQLRHYIVPSDSQQVVSNLNPITSGMKLSSKQLRPTSTFPNVDTALRMFLCMPIANCSGERSFTALKRVKNSLRSTIGQQEWSVCHY